MLPSTTTMTTTTLTTICTFPIGPWEWGWAMGFLTNGHALMVTMVAKVTWCVLCEVWAKGKETI
jgi:hypothetical protein